MTDGRSVVLQLTEAGLRKARTMLNDRTEVWMGVVEGMEEGTLGKLPSSLADPIRTLDGDPRGNPPS